MPLVVLAFGGHALDEHSSALADGAASVVQLIEQGWSVVVTHGNGPQVGVLMEQELAEPCPRPLYELVEQTQRDIGETLAHALAAALDKSELCLPHPAVFPLSVEVSDQDPEFLEPTKPVGRWLPGHVATRIQAEGYGCTYRDREGLRECRRLVPSPEPISILELESIADRLRAGSPCIVTCGGGGIPRVRCGDGYQGVNAVVDKDKASALLAGRLKADLLVIATSTTGVYLDFGTTSETLLEKIAPSELRALQASGTFPKGSMGPKVEAALRFVEGNAERRSAICDFSSIVEAVYEGAGTQVLGGRSDRIDGNWRQVP